MRGLGHGPLHSCPWYRAALRIDCDVHDAIATMREIRLCHSSAAHAVRLLDLPVTCVHVCT